MKTNEHEQVMVEEIDLLNSLFPGQVGRQAFEKGISWRERARRILALVKRLREAGDVYVVSRRTSQPDQWFYVAERKPKESNNPVPCCVVLSNAEENISGLVVTIMLPKHELPPARILYDGKVYKQLSNPHAYVFEQTLIEASL